MVFRGLGAVLLAVFVAVTSTSQAQAQAQAQPRVTLFAASSLTEIMQVVAQGFYEKTAIEVSVVPAGSATLAQQIVAGAPADIFISANRDWVAYVKDRAGYGTGVELFGNQLVLVAPAGSSLALSSLSGLGRVLGQDRLAMGDPDYVPAGIYGRQALKGAGVWSEIEPRIAPAANVRAALNLVIYGAAGMGIVYQSDARAGLVEIVLPIDPALHEKISYIASLAPNASDDAAAFFSYLQSSDTKEIARDMGYQVADSGQ